MSGVDNLRTSNTRRRCGAGWSTPARSMSAGAPHPQQIAGQELEYRRPMVWDTAAMAQQITDRRLPGVEPEIPRKVISGQVGDSLAALVSPSARVELEGLHDGGRLLERALEVRLRGDDRDRQDLGSPGRSRQPGRLGIVDQVQAHPPPWIAHR